ncbi:MAG: HD domain-containing phosphohydrolase [Pseudomonadota bacterium]
MSQIPEMKYIERIRKLQAHSVAIALEREHSKIIEMILYAIKDITLADGGTFYTLTEDNKLAFEVFANSTLGTKIGGSSGIPIPYPPLPLHDDEGKPNHSNIACHCALTAEMVNVQDAYQNSEFNFSGTKAFDARSGYRSQSVMAIPLKTVDNKVLGVIQLFNAKDEKGQTTSFHPDDIEMARFLCTHAASTLSNFQLNNELQQLFVSMAHVLAYAIDNKSPYTGGHCNRVPEVAMMTLQAVIQTTDGPLKYFSLNEEQIREMELAALLHDCGKVTTPVHIMDKATKLETIFDRIHLLDTRFEILKRDAQVEYLQEQMAVISGQITSDLKEARKKMMMKMTKYDEDLAFIRKCNKGTEFMAESDRARIKEIAAYKLKSSGGGVQSFLTDDEIKNLTIVKGTLTEEERKVINDHIVVTLKMLGQLKFPANLKNIPEIAGSHHERIDGKGYPRGLKGPEMSVQARILCLADVFEALTANDRPYKEGKTLQETLFIMGKMVEDGHLDTDIFQIFLEKKIYLEYARKYLRPSQYSHLDLAKIPGHRVDNIDITKTTIEEKKAA